MNGRPLFGFSLLLAALIGLVVGRFTGGEEPVSVGTPDAMESALRGVFVESDPLVRTRAMEHLIDQLDARNLPGAIAVFREFSTRAGTLGVSEFFARWSRIDVEGLAAAMKDWPDQDAAAQGTAWIAYQYAYEGGTKKAAPFYSSLKPRIRLVTGYRLVEGALNGGDEQGLVDWISTLDDAADRGRLTQSILMKLLREHDTERAIAFFDAVPLEADHAYKRQVFLTLLDKLIRRDAKAAIAFREARASEPYGEDSLSPFVAAWADVDPTAALAWLGTRPADPDREEALETLVDRWATHDQLAAIEWTRGQLPSPMIDRLCRRFVATLTIRDPELAMELAARIVDREMRTTSLRAFARYWFTRQPEQTRTWLVAGGLSEPEAKAMVDELSLTRAQRLERLEQKRVED